MSYEALGRQVAKALRPTGGDTKRRDYHVDQLREKAPELWWALHDLLEYDRTILAVDPAEPLWEVEEMRWGWIATQGKYSTAKAFATRTEAVRWAVHKNRFIAEREKQQC